MDLRTVDTDPFVSEPEDFRWSSIKTSKRRRDSSDAWRDSLPILTHLGSSPLAFIATSVGDIELSSLSLGSTMFFGSHFLRGVSRFTEL